jgi:hypothetical protein
MKYKDITLDGINYEVYFVKGKVLGKDKHLETKVSGGGGGGYSYNGRGSTAPISISSTTIVHDKIYIDLGNGKEHSIELEDWDIACREGHEMVFVWMIKQGKNVGPYIALANMVTDEIYIKKSIIRKELSNAMIKIDGNGKPIGCILFFLFAFLAIILAWIGYGISQEIGSFFGIIAAISMFIYVKKGSKKLDAKTNQFYNEINLFLKTQ